MSKTIDLQAQNAMAVRSGVLDHGTSANGKSAPNTFERWAVHARAFNQKQELVPGKQIGTTTIRRVAGKWRPLSPGGSHLGEAARLLATVR